MLRTVYAGHGVKCPCCGSTFRRFEGFKGTPNRRCWTCRSLERHRQVALLLDHRPELRRQDARVLHVAPEDALRRLVEPWAADYVTADLDEPGVDLHFDLTESPLDDDSFDVILCNHVMEHIPDDAAALSEIRRMLAPGGWALLMTPIVVDTTIEDLTVTDPEERLRRFGQHNHVRRYGWDYVDRLEQAGLSVTVVRQESELGPAAVRTHRLENLQGFVEPIFVVS